MSGLCAYYSLGHPLVTPLLLPIPPHLGNSSTNLPKIWHNKSMSEAALYGTQRRMGRIFPGGNAVVIPFDDILISGMDKVARGDESVIDRIGSAKPDAFVGFVK